jgi:predicted transcriptional regulator
MRIKHLYHSARCTLRPDMTVKEALVAMHEGHSNGSVVLDDSGKIVGILTIQDLAGAVVPPEYSDDSKLAAALYREGYVEEQIQAIATRPIAQIMRREFVTVEVEDNLLAIMADFLQNDLYILPVLDKGVFVGVISRRDVKDMFITTLGLDSA